MKWNDANWELGRDLVNRKAEETWGSGIVEQVSLDLQSEFPEARGFSTRNLWNMKKWYLFYASNRDREILHQVGEEIKRIPSVKLEQLAKPEPLEKVHQSGAEFKKHRSRPFQLGLVPVFFIILH